MLYAMCLLLLVIGLYCVLVKKNMVKIIIGMAIMEYAVNLLLIMVGFRVGGQAPIVLPNRPLTVSVDPLPQALVLTAIVISLGTLALSVAVCIRIYEKYGTFDITEIRRLRG